MNRTHLRRIPPARAAVRPSMDCERRFGPLGSGPADSGVGEGRPSLDADLERHIRECGQEMEAAYSRYQADNELASLGDAHYWRNAMEQAIKGRSAEQVACMEQNAGLS